MTTLIRSLAASRYAATPAQVEDLARCVADGAESAGTYLQTLIAATQAAMPQPSRGRRLPLASVLAAIESAYKPSYEAVQRGVARGEQLTPRGLASRSGFARTSASALRKYAEGGGDVRALVPGEVSRRMLRPEGPAVPAGTTKAERTVLMSVERIKRVADRAAKRDAAEGRLLLESAVELLSARLDALADGNAEQPRVTRHQLERVGTVTHAR